MMTLIQLEYITTLDTYRHFATAAEKCFVTQPTLSMQIKKLEDELGVLLFDRTRQPVIPTEEGKQLIAQARVVLQEAGKMGMLVDDIKNDLKGGLRIALLPTIAPFLLPLFAGDFKSRYPGINLKFREDITGNIEDMLLKDQLDVGIAVTPLRNPQIFERKLYFEQMMVYHHPDHDMSKQSLIKLDEMDPSEIWLLGDGHCFRHQVINFCEIRSLQANELPYDFEGGSIETLMRIIDKEGGYTLIPELAVQQRRMAGRVKEFLNPVPLREVSLIYTRKFAKLKLIEKLAQMIRSVVPGKMLDRDRGTIVDWR